MTRRIISSMLATGLGMASAGEFEASIKPLCNLHRSMLKRMGAPVDHLADSTGGLDNLQG